MVNHRGDSALETAKSAVADASVIARWYVKEDQYQKALEVREDYRKDLLNLVEPSLLLFEVSNALRYSPELGADDVKNSVHSMVDLQFDIRELDQEWASLCVESAYKYGISIYDSTYVSLAQRLGIKFITADEKLTRRIPKENTVTLENYSLKQL